MQFLHSVHSHWCGRARRLLAAEFWHGEQWECAVQVQFYDLRAQLMCYYIFRVSVATEVSAHSRKA